MTKRIIVLLMTIHSATFAFGQDLHHVSTDSVFFLNVAITYKLKIIKSYSNTITTDAIMIDFPASYYDKSSKTIMLLPNSDPITIKDSTFALIRVSEKVDESYGNGSADHIIQYLHGPVFIDTAVIVESVSKSGTFYLKVKNRKIKLNPHNNYAFLRHKKVKTREAMLDYVTEYALENFGYIARRINSRTELNGNN